MAGLRAGVEQEAAGLVEKAQAARGRARAEASKAGAAELGPEEAAGEVGAEQPPGEVGGPKGPEPTRFGDWERDGRCSDF